MCIRDRIERYTIERYLHALHRATGIYLVFFVISHIIITGLRADYNLWVNIRGALENPIMLSFMVALLFHGLNGIRLLLAELGLIVGKPKTPIFPYISPSISGIEKLSVVLVLIAYIILLAIVLSEFTI